MKRNTDLQNQIQESEAFEEYFSASKKFFAFRMKLVEGMKEEFKKDVEFRKNAYTTKFSATR